MLRDSKINTIYILLWIQKVMHNAFKLPIYRSNFCLGDILDLWDNQSLFYVTDISTQREIIGNWHTYLSIAIALAMDESLFLSAKDFYIKLDDE